MAEQITNEKQEQRDAKRLKEITDGIEKGIKELFESDRYRSYLSTMSRFHHYSVNNTVLIHMQKPDATLVAGFNRWRDQFGRHVKKGSKSIQIIAPIPYKRTVEKVKLDPDTKEPMLDENGKIIKEEKEITVARFKVVSVFDVSQTDGKPLPELASDLAGNVERYEEFVEALRRTSPVPIGFKDIPLGTDGYFSEKDQSISIREGMSEVQTISAIIHEIAHSKLHNPALMEQPIKLVMVSEGGTRRDFEAGFADEDAAMARAEELGWRVVDENRFEWRLEMEEDPESARQLEKSRRTEEVEAESISYAVCQYYGIETAENSFGYIASWSQGKELKELRASLETINKTSSALITDIDRHFAAICKERGITQKAEEIEPDEAVLSAERLYTVDDNKYLHVQRCEDGFDYTLYDMQSKKLLDGGQVDLSAELLSEAALEICKLHGIGDKAPIRLADISILDDLQSVEVKAWEDDHVTGIKLIPTEESTPFDVPPVPERKMEEPERPDPLIRVEDMRSFGYCSEDMLPLSKDRALELMEQDITVYLLYGDDSEAMALNEREIIEHEGLFGITNEDWEAIRDEIPPRDMERRFMDDPEDGILIYQLREDAPAALFFAPYDRLEEAPKHENYVPVYTQAAPSNKTGMEILEDAFAQFNYAHPSDFTGHSMSMSDVVALKKDGKITPYYCDRTGFRELLSFAPENPLQAAEMSVEDDYGMIDGIINNGAKDSPKEPERKISLKERLQSYAAQSPEPAAVHPKKSHEWEAR